MGHSSRKSNQSIPSPQGLDFNALGQIMKNIDVSAMANMLNSIDINQVMSMLSGAGGMVPAAASSEEAAQIKVEETTRSDSAPNQTYSIPIPASTEPINLNPNPTFINPVLPPNDPIALVLNSIKPFLPQDKCKIIDDMISLLGIKLVIDSIFPAKIQK